jgi:hypothetical protein
MAYDSLMAAVAVGGKRCQGGGWSLGLIESDFTKGINSKRWGAEGEEGAGSGRGGRGGRGGNII